MDSPIVVDRRDRPPWRFDLVRHVTELAAVALPAALVAVTVAAGVLLYRSIAPERYEATLLCRVQPQGIRTDSPPDSQLALLSASYIELASDPLVLKVVAASTGAQWDVAETQSRINVDQGVSAGLLQVRVLGDGPAQARSLTETVVSAVSASVRTRAERQSKLAAASLRASGVELTRRHGIADSDSRRQSAAADRYRDYFNGLFYTEPLGPPDLVPLTDPSVPDSPTSPEPVREAALAFLVAVVLVAEGLVLQRRLSRRVTRTTAARLSGRHGILVAEVQLGSSVWDSPQPKLMVDRCLRQRLDVLVLFEPQMPPQTSEVLRRLALPASHEVSGAAHADGSPERPPLVFSARADMRWWRFVVLRRIGLALVIVPDGSSHTALLRSTLTELADAGIPAMLGLVNQASGEDQRVWSRLMTPWFPRS